MHHRLATPADAEILGELNYQLIQDEGHRNRMTIPDLVTRLKQWLAGSYRASIFEDDSGILAYALYREEADHIYLRHFFVQRVHRRKGVGRQCMQMLVSEVFPKGKRITLNVLCHNQPGIAFWRSIGFADYCLILEKRPDHRID